MTIKDRIREKETGEHKRELTELRGTDEDTFHMEDLELLRYPMSVGFSRYCMLWKLHKQGDTLCQRIEFGSPSSQSVP